MGILGSPVIKVTTKVKLHEGNQLGFSRASLGLSRAVKTHFKKPRFFRFLKNLKSDFLLFHVKLYKIL